MQADLSKFDVGNYKAGPPLKVFFWFFINYYIFDSVFPWPYKIKLTLLRLLEQRLEKA